jgi:hypothetical protein
MWHLFGPLVRWPLHSPRRLLGVIAAAVAAVMLLGAINDRGPEPATAAGATATATATPEAGDSAPTRSPEPSEAGDGTEAPAAAAGTDAFSEDPAADDPVVAAQQASAEFVAQWARPDLDAATWQAGLAPRATPELMASLAATDPANVPAVTVTGPPVPVAANAEAAVFDVPTTGDFVRVFLQLVGGAWLVTDVQPTT